MTNVALSQLIELRGAQRAFLVVELLVFALPCYLIYTICMPLALLGIWTFAEMLLDLMQFPRPVDAVADLLRFTPLAIASLTAFIGFPVLVMFAKLLIWIFRGSVNYATAKAMLAKTLRRATLPLTVMFLYSIYGAWTFKATDTPNSFEQTRLAETIFDVYLSGRPLLIPAFHLRRIFAAAGKLV